MPREVVWVSPDHDAVCTLTHRFDRSPSDYEVRLTTSEGIVAARVFPTRADALAEAERLRQQVVDPDSR